MADQDNAKTAPQRALVHAEAEIGSSHFDFHIENCDGLQLLGLAEVIHAQGLMALAADMQTASRQARNGLVVAGGRLA